MPCIPGSACFGQLKWFCFGPLAWTAWRKVLQWERGLGQEASLWSLTQTYSVPPMEERRGDSWLLHLHPFLEQASIT